MPSYTLTVVIALLTGGVINLFLHPPEHYTLPDVLKTMFRAYIHETPCREPNTKEPQR